ncbi:hypothetical protein PYW08_011591 [Mythimna loreyi]|uniref:Uncharacterized protein n=1 Tax=Mythimna loreyi TaxID=667449 RepID=A0ACC2QJY9_9NEOP|nr:hypothetical protein PYW08_011591 [Mythimna loreyi]
MTIPQCKRCCCCLPLRPGLLAWGYFKIIVDVLVIPFLVYFLLTSILISLSGLGHSKHLIWIILFAAIYFIIFFMFITDLVVSIMFVIAAHKKNVKLIRAFYIYSVVLFILSALLILVGVIITILKGLPNSVVISSVTFVGWFLILVVQGYFILLLRSEVIKLDAGSRFKFVNRTEAQCMMIRKENDAVMETV